MTTRRNLHLILGAILLLAPVWCHAADLNPATMQVVVSVRQYTPAEKHSHHRLFLYSGDGKLVRQLTNPGRADDFNPVFSPDGKQLVFMRKGATARGWYRIDDLQHPNAIKLADQEALPSWFHPAEDLKRIDERQGTPDHGAEGIKENTPLTERYNSRDGSQTLEIHYSWPSETGNTDEGEFFMIPTTMWLRDRVTSETLRISKFPGFEGLGCAWLIDKSPFFIRPPMRALFLECHRGSGYGEAIYGVDLDRRIIHLLTPAGDGTIIPAPNEIPAFFCICQELYQDLGNGHSRINCEYLDFWDAKFKRTRFSPPLSRFGGAAILIPGQSPLTIPVPDYSM